MSAIPLKKKTSQSKDFLESLCDYIVKHPQYRQDTRNKSEGQIQTEIRPIILRFLETHFEDKGYVDYTAKANTSFYWEGQEGAYGREREKTFGARNYPDFIVTDPYLVAIEYKQSSSGGLVKHGIGQSIMHTLSGDYDFVLFIFHDQNHDKRIAKSMEYDKEQAIIDLVWNQFNVLVSIV